MVLRDDRVVRCYGIAKVLRFWQVIRLAVHLSAALGVLWFALLAYRTLGVLWEVSVKVVLGLDLF